LDSSSPTFAAITVLNQDSTYQGADHAAELQAARTPQVISCRLSPTDTPTKLFQFIARGEAGDWSNKNLKISIQDIKRSTSNGQDYGTFSVVIRHISDSDNVVRVVEQFNNCNLNPNSLDYVARKIGDYYEEWNTTERRYIQKGNYRNNSQYVYISMNSDVDAGNTNPALLPFGFEGILKYTDEADLGDGGTVGGGVGNWVSGSEGGLFKSVPASYDTLSLGTVFQVSGSQLTSSVEYPRPVFRSNATDGNLSNPTDAYFGLQTNKSAGSTVFDKSTIDLLRPRGGVVGEFAALLAASASLSPTFTLDDIKTGGVYSADSYNVDSLTFQSGAVSGVLDAGYDRFTVPLFGGFDGVDVAEMDPFTKAAMNTAPTDDNDYAFFSIRRAIDSVADPEVVEMNLASIPGQTQDGLTTHLVRTCEDRGDALAVIDLPNAFQPREDSDQIDRLNTQSTITTLVNGLRDRGLNTSYGCAY